MSHKVIVVKDELGNLHAGTVLHSCKTTRNYRGEECWNGLVVCGPASWYESIPKRLCEIWEEEKHDSTYMFRKYLAEKSQKEIEAAERATLAHLKIKYEKE